MLLLLVLLKLLGGTDKPLPVYWSTGSTCEPKKHAKMAKKAEEEGYKGVKLRVHAKTLEEDVKAVKETREIMGKEFPVGIDANQGWRVTIVDKTPAWDLTRAKSFINEMEGENISWLEEPLYMRAYEDLAELRKESSINISGAELNYGWDEVRMMLHFGSFDIYQPDVTFHGVVDTLKTIEATKKKGLGFSPHTWTNGIGLLANMHMFSLTTREHPLEFPHEAGSWTPEVLGTPAGTWSCSSNQLGQDKETRHEIFLFDGR
ncbi:MAG: enolase C-terminal domain-like protein [Candidatus Hodarchaeales archaeon]